MFLNFTISDKYLRFDVDSWRQTISDTVQTPMPSLPLTVEQLVENDIGLEIDSQFFSAIHVKLPLFWKYLPVHGRIRVCVNLLARPTKIKTASYVPYYSIINPIPTWMPDLVAATNKKASASLRPCTGRYIQKSGITDQHTGLPFQLATQCAASGVDLLSEHILHEAKNKGNYGKTKRDMCGGGRKLEEGGWDKVTKRWRYYWDATAMYCTAISLPSQKTPFNRGSGFTNFLNPCANVASTIA